MIPKLCLDNLPVDRYINKNYNNRENPYKDDWMPGDEIKQRKALCAEENDNEGYQEWFDNAFPDGIFFHVIESNQGENEK